MWRVIIFSFKTSFSNLHQYQLCMAGACKDKARAGRLKTVPPALPCHWSGQQSGTYRVAQWQRVGFSDGGHRSEVNTTTWMEASPGYGGGGNHGYNLRDTIRHFSSPLARWTVRDEQWVAKEGARLCITTQGQPITKYAERLVLKNPASVPWLFWHLTYLR